MSAGWQSRAACREVPSELFFPSSTSHSENRRREMAALAICRTCPVQSDCHDFAQTSNMGGKEQWGIWAGRNYSPKKGETTPEPPWRRPRTLECEICGTRWRWTPSERSGSTKAPQTCSARCLGELRSRLAVQRYQAGIQLPHQRTATA